MGDGQMSEAADAQRMFAAIVAAAQVLADAFSEDDEACIAPAARCIAAFTHALAGEGSNPAAAHALATSFEALASAQEDTA